MVGDISVRGANQLADLAKDLKAAGYKELRRELYRGISRAMKPLAEEARKSARENLPRRGGLNEVVASSRFTARSRMAGRNPGVRLVGAKKGHDLSAIDRGRLRHPVFGNDWWVTQIIEPGWFTDGLSDSVVVAPVRKEILRAMDDVARRLARG